MSGLSIRFWGVRGSVPSPGPETAGYGGNTSCVEVRAGSELIILDMGSGLRPLGDALNGTPVKASMFLSHYHWDHIQGLPFFGAAFNPKNSFTIYGPNRGELGVKDLLSGQMVDPYFPVPFDIFGAKMSFRPIESGEAVQVGECRVTARALNHPGGVLAYRIDYNGRSVVYATDNEHGTATDEVLVEFSRGADCLIFDAMYTPDEYVGTNGFSKTGWGHSTWEEAVKVVQQAGVRKLILFHHEPKRTDEGVDQILELTRAHHPDTIAAREGERIDL